ncbi:hypothetical protein MFU01_37430 [Myxococcus fulvus]|uniref:TPR domain-containing protein n=2 Tax=Myxococcus fulvus TaxID=33 RepID=A0A511T3G4_MYXFU|nr:hypothetical protein MFU01_37430 [Myxococcus fulvus]
MSLALALAGGAQALPIREPVTTAGFVARTFDERLDRAARLYERLEYELALASLADAQTLARTDEQRANALLYEGIVLADLLQHLKSLSAFRKGLMLRPEASLPIKVSPKVQRDFDEVRKEVRKDLGLPPTTPPGRASAEVSDRPALLEKTVPGLSQSSPLPRSEPPPVYPIRANKGATRAHIPLAIASVGIVSASVGSYFGVISRGSIQNAREASSLDAQRQHLGSARGEVITANVLFGLAVASVTGAVILYLTAPSEQIQDGLQ